MNNKILIFIILVSSIIGCTGSIKDGIKYYKKDGNLIMERYNNGHIKVRCSYNNDTIFNGYYEEYYNNGLMRKWLWYDDEVSPPIFGIYFDSNGKYIRYGGTPFIRTFWNFGTEKVVEIVNPPITFAYLKYEELESNSLVSRVFYEPVKTDSTAWVTLNELKEYKSDRNYFITYYICDYDSIPIDSIKTELVP